MGKKIKKLVKKATKFISKIDPLRGGDVILDSMGLPSMMGEDKGMLTAGEREDKAAKAAQAEEAERRRAEEAALQAQRDAAADLSNREVADVNIGAGAGSGGSDPLNRRKKQGVSLSDSLGLRV